jgi:threonine aldolase
VGSVLVGSPSLIRKAKHFRKLFGGGWRQAGLLAAAGLYALDHHYPNLHKDHENARLLAEGIEKVGMRLTRPCETNMVWFDTLGVCRRRIFERLRVEGIRVFEEEGAGEVRLVVHHQISRVAVGKVVRVLSDLFVEQAKM